MNKPIGNHGNKGNVITSTIIMLGVFLMISLLFAYGKSLIRTAQRNTEIEAFREENERLALEKEASLDKLLYLQSDQFKDKWAKERKNKANPGENILILPAESDLFQPNLENLSVKEQKIEILKSRPNREQWWEFFFGAHI